MTIPYTFNIENIVVSADLHRKIDLNVILKEYNLSGYNPKTFPGLIYRANIERYKDIHAKTVLVFRTGKLILNGIKSLDYLESTIDNFVRHVIETTNGKQIEKPTFKVANIVTSGYLKGNLDFEDIRRLAIEYRDRYHLIYEPDQFPAAIISDKLEIKLYEKQVEKNAKILLFSSAKYVITGCKSIPTMKTRIEDLYKALFDLRLIDAEEQVLVNLNN